MNGMSQCESPLNKRVCHESHDKMLANVPKPLDIPSISQNDLEAGEEDTHMEDATAEKEKKYVLRQSTSDQKDARAEIR